MADNLFITATEARSGKSLVSLGIMEMLLRKIDKVGFFRPIINTDPAPGKQDNDIELISSHFKLEFPYEKMYGFTTKETADLISQGRENEILEGVIKKYTELKKSCDFVLCEGTDYASSSSAFELDINAEISKNLGAPVLLVSNAYQKSVDDAIRSIELSFESLREKGCKIIATIVNRASLHDGKEIVSILKENEGIADHLIFAVPDEPSLGNPTVGEIADLLEAEVLYGEEQLNRHVYNFTVAAMQLRHFLTMIGYGSLIITPGDREDVIIASLASVSSSAMDNIAGILLTGGLKPEEPIWNLIQGFPRKVPVLSVKQDTFPTATLVDKIHAVISPDDHRKITQALGVFEKNIDVEQLGEKVITSRTTTVTPKMFEYELVQKARADKQHIVLPEGDEERILRATEILLRRGVADITLLGNEQTIREKASALCLHIENATIIDPVKSDGFNEYAKTFFELRKHKGITMENARDVMSDVNFFGTMMIYKGRADGMVSGSVHSTAATIRPALQIIKTKPGFTIVSSVFLMCLADRVLVYGDCAVNPNPNASQLAEIALSSAHTAKTFGIEPVIAMLSYSTGGSGTGEDVEKVREATRIAQEKAKESYPGLKIDGPIQYDAAVDASVAKTKMPDSEVAGKATVFVFPDLNTGNNTYKAVQRSAGAVAIGPVLQGLKCPVNDLSRGCTITDIVNTVAITAVQAQ
ncbi:MAG: phosphate acetyltransferase [Deltaproteobacteria bacterium]|jgi:phosphate acetyltransferase|nr:phosphate acetyltransferase [Deltaproteobacteria bacterium]